MTHKKDFFKVKILCINSHNIQKVKYKYTCSKKNMIKNLRYSLYIFLCGSCIINIFYLLLIG